MAQILNHLVRVSQWVNQTFLFGWASLMARMSDEKMIRVENVNLLLKERGWQVADLARAIKKSDTYAGKLANGKGSFGEKAARHVEEACGKPRGWLDQIHTGGDYSPETLKEMGRPPQTGGSQHDPQVSEQKNIGHIELSLNATNIPSAPVVTWGELGGVLYKDNDEWPVAARKVVPTIKPVSNKAKWLLVENDALMPRVARGDMIAVDPEAKPANEGLALIRAADGSYMVRFWRPLAGGAFEAFDGSGRTIDSERHGLSVAGAVVCLYREQI